MVNLTIDSVATAFLPFSFTDMVVVAMVVVVAAAVVVTAAVAAEVVVTVMGEAEKPEVQRR